MAYTYPYPTFVPYALEVLVFLLILMPLFLMPILLIREVAK
jgi:hypothetical protein